MTKLVDVAEARDSFSELLSLVTQGTEVVVTQDGRPVACLVPAGSSRASRILGLHPGAMEMGPDFDAPLPDSFWLGSE
jgi:prevent-host-death family protein